MAVNTQHSYMAKYTVCESCVLNLPAFLANVIPTFHATMVRPGRGNSRGFLFQMIKTKSEELHGREGWGTEGRTPLFFVSFSLEEILAPKYSTVGRHLESGLICGHQDSQIRYERERPCGGGRKGRGSPFSCSCSGVLSYPIPSFPTPPRNLRECQMTHLALF